MYKINNSYESDQSTSNSSSSDGLKRLTLGWDSLHNHQQLREYFFPPVHAADQTACEQMKNDRYENDSNLTSSKHSDFLGFSSSSNDTPPINKPIVDHVAITIVEAVRNGCTIKEASGSTAESLEKSNVSEEFSDQDVRFQIDMQKPDEIFNTFISNNEAFENISQYTIEPTSSDDDAQQSDESATDDTLTNLPTLSVNENSSNAIDLTISSITYISEPELIKDLSFNGKLYIESQIIEPNGSSVSGFGRPLQAPECESKNETPNTSERSNLEIQLHLETSREHINERSPDLFSDEEYFEEEATQAKNIEHSTSVASIGFDEKENQADDYIEKIEKQINKRMQSLLSGILPPPSVTYVDHDITSLLTLYNKNVAPMGLDHIQKNIAADDQSNRWIPKELDNIEWPHIERVNAHGLHYNRTKYTDNLEIMYMKLVERNVGQETGSSFTYNVSTSAKKKPIRKVIASPGNRLSHLARRRTAFSSATLQSQAQLLKLGRKPCVIDASKITRKEKVATPKRRGQQLRRTPGRKTPGSLKKSAKKAAISVPKPAIPTRETSKRALFLSPAQEEVKPNIAPEISRRVEKSKRALFSPPRRLERSFSNISTISCTSALSNSNTKFIHGENSLTQTNFDIASSLKRKRECDDGENMEPNCSKLTKYQGNLTSSRLKSSSHLQSSLPKAASESSMYQNNQLSASHKQKLLWAVSTALKKKSITTSHQSFNHLASVLAKVVKRLYLESFATKMESTSGTMLRLADRLVFYVIQGKTVDEIYLDEKHRLGSAKVVNKRPSGYINRDEYLMRQDFACKLNTSIKSNSSEPANENDIERKPLTNSTSKSNVGVNALRENHDSKSAQKSSSNISFSGRNQKNLSPYNDKSRSASNLNNKQNKILIGSGSTNLLQSNIMKVKRQISFDN